MQKVLSDPIISVNNVHDRLEKYKGKNNERIR